MPGNLNFTMIDARFFYIPINIINIFFWDAINWSFGVLLLRSSRRVELRISVDVFEIPFYPESTFFSCSGRSLTASHR